MPRLKNCINLAVCVGVDTHNLQSFPRQEELEALQASMSASFGRTKVESDQAWKALCAAQAMGIDLRDCSLRRVSEAGQNHMSTFRIEHGSVESSITIANERLTTLQCARDDVEVAANVGFGILTLGVWSIVGAVNPEDSCTEVIGLEAQSRAIEYQLAENHSAFTETQNDFSELESRKTSLDRKNSLLREVLERIRGVEESFKQKTLEIGQFARDVVAMKNVVEPIWKRITRMKDTATTVVRHAVVQKEYADALIDMCILGCEYVRRARIIDQILREVSFYPAMAGSESLRSKLKEAEEKCRMMLSQARVD